MEDRAVDSSQSLEIQLSLETAIFLLETRHETWPVGLQIWLVTCSQWLGTWLETCSKWHGSQVRVAKKTMSLYSLGFDILIIYNFSISYLVQYNNFLLVHETWPDLPFWIFFWHSSFLDLQINLFRACCRHSFLIAVKSQVNSLTNILSYLKMMMILTKTNKKLFWKYEYPNEFL